MARQTMLHLQCSGVAIASLVVGTLSILPASAQTANFGTIEVASGFGSARAEGYTQGSFSLSSIANRDRAGNLCIGFADSTPDHILVLERDLPRLSLQVRSEGDTTLLVQGNGTIRCGDDLSRSEADAVIQDTDWKAGEYRVWVGSFESSVRIDYTLTVQE